MPVVLVVTGRASSSTVYMEPLLTVRIVYTAIGASASARLLTSAQAGAGLHAHHARGPMGVTDVSSYQDICHDLILNGEPTGIDDYCHKNGCLK